MNKTTLRIRGTTPEIESAAKKLRYNLTPAEQILWQALKRKQLHGLKFRCQHPVGPFIADFLCAKHKLIIELDGTVHNQQTDYDNSRTEQLKAYGYQVVRFRNQEVFANLDAVLERILEAVSALS
ncbi:MAG TPA: endonuclease domain-containing protein [Allocoleopsis sp.]